MRIAIVGAGIAGLTCATVLARAGHAVALFDKGRGPGGRMATRRIATADGEAAFDHGAGWFAATDPEFRARCESWRRDGLAAPWPAAGPDAWVGTPSANAPASALARALDVRRAARVEAVEPRDGLWRVRGEGFDESGFDAALVAVPAEQAEPLLAFASPAMAARAASAPSLPCWTAMAAFARPVPVEADLLAPSRGAGILWRATRENAKPGRSGPERWVAHAWADWSARHLEEAPDAVLGQLLGALAAAAGGALPEPVAAAAHRWRYAHAGRDGAPALWDATARIGACGDWLLGATVEGAWRSGRALARAVLEGG